MPKGLRIFDKYEIIRRIATGGMGDIFLARQLGIAGFQRLVVLKSLRPEIVEREDVLAMFLNEARTAAKINHPNIVAVYEIDEFRGIYFIAMELIQGADLRTLFRASEWHRQRIPYRVVAAIIRDAALGLDHAHRAPGENNEPLSIVHRDVSPANIMVRLDGVTKVVDFGIAAANTLESRAKVQGKLRYMSPEQILGLPVDGGADQFSLGIVLWELCTGKRLFDDDDASKILEQIAVDPIKLPSSVVADIPPELEAITMKMLARTRIERFAHLGEAAAALGDLVYRAGSPPEQQVARFVQALVGKQVAQLTQNLEMEDVVIPGLLEAAEVVCRACGEKNSMRNRFCSSCGKPLAQVTASFKKQPIEERSTEVPAPARARVVRELLFEEAASLGDLLESEKKEVAVLAAYVRGRERLMRELDGPRLDALDRRLVDALSAVAERFGVLVLRLTREEVLLVFGADARAILEPMRALECALELEHAIDTVNKNLSLSIAIDCGQAEVSGGRGARNTATGETIDRAPKLASIAAAVGKKGVLITDPLAQRLEGLVKLAPETLAIEGRAIVALRLIALTPRAFAAEVPLVGRKDELAAIRDAINEAKEASGSGLLFFGAPGSGKTRLLREAGELARRMEARVVHATELADDFNAAVLLSDAERRLIVVLADDLHLFEPEVFERLSLIAQRSSKLHLGIIATADASRAASLDLPWATKLELRPLSDEKMLAIAQHRLDGKPLPQAAAQVVLERAQGSPRSLLLVLDALIDRGGLLRQGDRWVASETITKLALPAENDDLLIERVEHLSRDARSFLRVAAVAGEAFSAEVVGAALGLGEHEAALVECMKSGLVSEVLVHPGAYQITDRSLRATLIERFPALDLEAVHTRLADVLDESPEREVPGVMAAIARHRIAARAGIPAADAAARAAAVLGKTREAGALYKEALRIREEDLAAGRVLDRETANALNDLATAATRCFAAFDLQEAEKALAPVMEHVPEKHDPSGRAFALAARGAVRLALGRLDLADRDLVRAMELALEVGATNLTAIALPQAAVWEARGRLGEAADLLKRTIATAPAGASMWEASNALGRLYFRMGQTERAATLFDAAIDEATGLGHHQGAIKAMINRALVAAVMKRHDDALMMLDRADARAESAGEVLERSRIAYNRGRILAERGQHDDARQAFERALDEARKVRWNEGIALATQALEAISRQ